MSRAKWKTSQYYNCVTFEQLLSDYRAARAAGLALNFSTGDRLLPDCELLDDTKHLMYFGRFMRECERRGITA